MSERRAKGEKRRVGLRAVLGACVALALLGAGVAPAQEPEGGAESRRRLEQIRQERERLREEMSRARTRVQDLSGEVRDLERQVGASANVVSELEQQLTEREGTIDQNAAALESTRGQLSERRAALNRRLRQIYKRGPLHTAEVLLTAESFADLINRYKYLFLIARRDRLLVDEIAALEGELVLHERALRREVSMMEGLRSERADETSQLDVLRAREQRALEDYRSREDAAARRIAQLEADESRLSSVVADLERRSREPRVRPGARTPALAAPPEPLLTSADLGQLDWPAEGRLLFRMGRGTRADGTVVRRNGVGIAAAAGTPVRAVEAGLVALAGPVQGYGPAVVISHGGGYYSLYLRMEEIDVNVGDSITRGARLGTVGGRTSPDGPHLELQIRAPGGQPVDPLGWLRRQGG